MLSALMLALTAAPATSDAQPPADAPAASARHTLQRDFDAATLASAEGRCEEAVPMFEALEKDSRVTPGSLPAAVIALRKGKCLVALGKRDEGVASIRAGLPKIDAAGESFSGDSYEGHMALGAVAASRYDFSAARGEYQAALKTMEGMNRLLPLMALAKTSAFEGTSEPLDYANEAIRIIDALPEPDKKLRASFMTVHARALLNQGQVKAAYAELKRALKLMGGLTMKVSLGEVSMRGDLALAALLEGKRNEAHLYLVYTGAGRIAESPFGSARNMDVPVCGSETGLRPEDEAVVEFAIDKDGSVYGAQTVYTPGGPEVAKAFAGAVRQWYWDSETLAKIPPFYLAATRVELRCTRAGADAPGIMSPLSERFTKWASAQLLAPTEFYPNTSLIEGLKRTLADPKVMETPARYVAAAGLLSFADSPQERQKRLDDALLVARQAALPDEVTNALMVFWTLAPSPWDNEKFKPKRDVPIYAKWLFDLAAESDMAKDALVAATLRLSGTKLVRWFKDPAPVVAQLKLVAEDSRLDDHHPLRQVANLQLANFAAQAHDLVAARSYFERTGLTEEQCSLLDVKPALRNANVSSSDYPTQAWQLGFEGWVNVEFDIRADGRTVDGRTLIAYPPFVFSDGAAAMSKDFRYASSYRPGGNMACAADREKITFRIP